MATPTSSMLTRLRAGAFALALSSSASNSGIPEAARVACGPERWHGREFLWGQLGRDVAHCAFKGGFGNAHDVIVFNDHLAAVITLRDSVPPLRISGSAKCAMRMKVQHETSIVVAKPSRGTSTTRPRSVSFGENAMEWTTKSSLPHCLPIRSKTASICPGVLTSSGIKIGASRARASGSTNFLALSLRYVTATSAPNARKALASPGDGAFVGDTDNEALLAFEELGFHRGEFD